MLSILRKLLALGLSVYALVVLRSGESWWASYLLMGLLGCVGVLVCSGKERNKLEKACFGGYAVLLSALVMLAEYKLYAFGGAYQGQWISVICVFVGLCIVFYNAALFLSCIRLNAGAPSDKKIATIAVRAIVCVFLLVHVGLLLSCRYPGLVTSDSADQMTQAITGLNYSNHHPFYHTMLIKCCLAVGHCLGGGINGGVLCYSLVQIVIIALCLKYVLSLLVRIDMPTVYIVAASCFYLLLPGTLVFSCAMWKDIIFSHALLVLTCALLTISLRGVSTEDLIALGVSMLIVCLFRSNGMFIGVLTFLVALVCFQRGVTRRALWMMGFVIVVCVILKGPVLSFLNVKQPDFIEGLSIPAQQIARVVHDGGEMPADCKESLSQVVDVEELGRCYLPYLSDPVKKVFRKHDRRQTYLREHKLHYLQIWTKIGLLYPGAYLFAWIDQTKGYWNGGYNSGVGLWKSYDGKEGRFPALRALSNRVWSQKIYRLLSKYVGLAHKNVFQPFMSCGVYFWITLLVVLLAWLRGRRCMIVVFIPALANVLSLLLATPVASEFRYVYSLYLVFPIVVVIGMTTNALSVKYDYKKRIGSDLRH